MTNEQIWQAVLGELELALSKANFTTWFKSTSIISKKDGEFIIGVPNAFTREWLQNKYHKNISRALQNITSERITRIEYILRSSQIAEGNLIQDISQKSSPTKGQPVVTLNVPKGNKAYDQGGNRINTKYTFDSFVVGGNNELAHAAAIASAEKPGSAYNPLFIYGGVGLGKTHLIQAIGNYIISNDNNKRVVYVTCEEFTEDFINFIQKGKDESATFKSKYRDCDVLLIDDVQFLSGKERTQEEFFHTFNALYQNNKQVILTSDRPPKAISALENRLMSRFEGGMIADVSIPDVETRKAILEGKCQEKNVSLPDEVLNYISINIQNNIRELEGALSTIIAHCQIHNINPTEKTAKTILANIITNPNKKVATPKKIVSTVANFYDIPTKNIIEKNRKKEIAWPRQIAMYLMREESKTSYPSIGRELGGRDHTTAIHAFEKVKKEVENSEDFRQEVEIIRQKLYLAD
ncbi:chromosomal replication initiator protein DnaA [Patescibacteria group bacterium]|nr:chromosomal replication initiator protein DnaA [Patescibacteria group bacterium]